MHSVVIVMRIFALWGWLSSFDSHGGEISGMTGNLVTCGSAMRPSPAFGRRRVWYDILSLIDLVCVPDPLVYEPSIQTVFFSFDPG